jgi:integrase
MATIRKRTWKTHGIENTAWVVDYRDQSGKRWLRTFTTKKAAESWAITALHEVAQGTHTPTRANITVSEADERWIANSEAEKLEVGTIRMRRQHLQMHIQPFISAEAV